MEQTRRDFLKNIAIISAANLMLPSWLRANPMGSIQVYFPELEGTKFTGSKVRVIDSGTGLELGAGVTTNSEATILFTPISVKDDTNNAGLLSELNIQDEGGRIIINYPVHSYSKVQFGLYDVTGRRIFEDTQFQGRGNHTHTVKVNHLASAHYFFRVITSDYMQTVDLPLHEGRVGNINTGQPVNMKTGKTISRLNKIGSSDYTIIVSNPKEHFTLTRTIAPKDKYEDKVVGFVQQPGVTPQLMKGLYQEVNFGKIADSGPTSGTFYQGLNYDGLKTFLQQPNTSWWLGFKNSSNQYIQTPEAQEYVKNIIITKILPFISTAYQPKLNVVDRTNPQQEPLPQGIVFIRPKSVYTSRISLVNFNTNGIIDTATISFGGGLADGSGSTWANPAYDQLKLRFLLQGICAPKDTQNTAYNNLTVLSTAAPAPELTGIDKKLIKIAEYYKPKSNIDDILGI